MERHLCGDGEAVAVGVGSLLEGVPHARIQHLLPGFEPPQKEMEIKTFLNDEGGFYSGILFMMIIYFFTIHLPFMQRIYFRKNRCTK